MGTLEDRNSCGTSNTHPPEWLVTMTSPEGRTGIELRKCTVCLIKHLDTAAVRVMGRTVTVRAL